MPILMTVEYFGTNRIHNAKFIFINIVIEDIHSSDLLNNLELSILCTKTYL